MRIGDTYSHKGGQTFIEENHPDELSELLTAIKSLCAVDSLCKKTSEKTKPPLLFSPVFMNTYLKEYLSPLGWTEPSIHSKKGFKEPLSLMHVNHD